MNKLLLIFSVLFGVTQVTAKENKDVIVSIIPLWGEEKLALNKIYNDLNACQFKLKTLKFYITGIKTVKDGKNVYSEKNSYHLIDLSNNKSLTWHLLRGGKKEFNTVNFQLGVDSLTNESGARGGDLDPIKGMYWSWQSGYINFKLEGDSNENNKKTNFDYHLGGYQSKFNAIQTISLNVKQNKVVQIGFDVKAFIKMISIQSNPKIMSPSLKSVELSKFAAKCFRIING